MKKETEDDKRERKAGTDRTKYSNKKRVKEIENDDDNALMERERKREKVKCRSREKVFFCCSFS